jgi:pimeloyl-ACP methyl ester carboxylesterase
MGQTGKFHPRRQPCLKILLCVAGIIFLFAFVSLRAVPGLFSKFDDPARLGVPVHLTVTNGFTIRWSEKSGASGRAALNLVFIHGTPGGAGVWASQFQTPFSNANLIAYNRPGFGGSRPVCARFCWLAIATVRPSLCWRRWNIPIKSAACC